MKVIVNEEGTSAETIWSYSNERANKTDANNALKRLYQKTGLRSQLEVNLPENLNKLGHFEAQFDVNIFASGIDHLVQQISTDQNVLTKLSRDLHQDYFMNQKNPDHLCWNFKRKKTDVKCSKQYLKRALTILSLVKQKVSQINLLNEKMTKIPKSKEQVERKKRELASYIQLNFLNNRFVLGSIMKLLKKDHSKITFTLQGEKVKNMTKLINL